MLIPDYSFPSLTDLRPEFLKSKGITFLMLDLDNTISPYKVDKPTEEICQWVDSVKAVGIELFIVSNSKRPVRTDTFAKILNVGFVKEARKPRPDAIKKIIGIKGIAPENAAMVGDQIYTDVISANLAKVTSIVIYPIKFTNILLRLRYWAEVPFRILCRKKYGRVIKK